MDKFMLASGFILALFGTIVICALGYAQFCANELLTVTPGNTLVASGVIVECILLVTVGGYMIKLSFGQRSASFNSKGEQC